MARRRDEFLIDSTQAGHRLDHVLRARLGVGLRGARRLIERGAVTLDGRREAAARRVREGQVLVVLGEKTPNPQNMPVISVLGSVQGFAGLVKPAGLHTAALVGGGASLEAMLPELLGEGWRLVNRLDLPTRGIVVAAQDAAREALFRGMENAGDVVKYYLARVAGYVGEGMTIRAPLDVADRARVRTLPGEDPDPLRWCHVEPVSHDPGADESLVRVIIHKGARHQVRVHLASVGHPLVGDAVYGESAAESGFYLHHFRIRSARFVFEDPSAAS
jgi:23S rRNA pseudouridine1911/1915/1917 synthase